jgi:hypothetical protein
MTNFVWTPLRYRNAIGILKNPFYAGIDAYGKSEKRTAIVDGRARRSYGHGKPVGTWEVMIKDLRTVWAATKCRLYGQSPEPACL